MRFRWAICGGSKAPPYIAILRIIILSTLRDDIDLKQIKISDHLEDSQECASMIAAIPSWLYGKGGQNSGKCIIISSIQYSERDNGGRRLVVFGNDKIDWVIKNIKIILIYWFYIFLFLLLFYYFLYLIFILPIHYEFSPRHPLQTQLSIRNIR